MKINIYTIEDCVFCEKTKAALDCRRKEYYTNVISEEEKKIFMDNMQSSYNFPNSERTFPKIFVDGELIGGYTDLKKLILRGKV